MIGVVVGCSFLVPNKVICVPGKSPSALVRWAISVTKLSVGYCLLI